MLTVGQVEAIRLMVLNQGASIRGTTKALGVSRNTVRKYLAQSEPLRRESAPRARPVLERAQARMDALLEEWGKRTTAKQRVTGTRLHRALVEEGYQVGATTVRSYLRERRRRQAEVYVPLVHRAGDEGQVDFFEVTVDLNGERVNGERVNGERVNGERVNGERVNGSEMNGRRVKAWKFVMRLMYSGRDFIWLYERCDQLSFLDGHVRAFAHFGGVPRRGVYDNLTAAVKRRMGMARELTERFQALASHYCFEPCFARPGEGHDKGGVESRGKAIRLQHLTPIPRGADLSEVSQAVLSELDQTCFSRRDSQGRTVAARFEEERAVLLPLPAVAFEACHATPVSVSRQATVRVEGATYSVPCSWASLQAMARIGVEDIRFECRGQHSAARRAPHGGRRIDYRHYLPELRRKPQAVRQVAPELMAQLGPPFGAFWQVLNAQRAPLDAARAMAEVLGLVVEQGRDAIAPILERMLADGSGDLLTLSQALRPNPAPAVCVPERLQRIEVEAGRAADYDRLLEGGAL